MNSSSAKTSNPSDPDEYKNKALSALIEWWYFDCKQAATVTHPAFRAIMAIGKDALPSLLCRIKIYLHEGKSLGYDYSYGQPVRLFVEAIRHIFLANNIPLPGIPQGENDFPFEVSGNAKNKMLAELYLKYGIELGFFKDE